MMDEKSNDKTRKRRKERSGNEPQRQRQLNFSSADEEFLVTLILNKINVIENKKTDTLTDKEKTKAWTQVAAEFNAEYSPLQCRTVESLRNKYAKIKLNLRKQQKKYEKITGDGPSWSSPPPLSDIMLQLEQVVALSVHSMPNAFTENQTEPNDNVNDPLSYATMSPPALERARHRALATVRREATAASADQGPRKIVMDAMCDVETVRLEIEKQRFAHDREIHLARMAHKQELHRIQIAQNAELHRIRIVQDEEMHRYKIKNLRARFYYTLQGADNGTELSPMSNSDIDDTNSQN